jgi:antitoxin component YwqK of YwqJK toxin-antitoxin module
MKQYFILGCFVGSLILSACELGNQRSRNKNPGSFSPTVETISVPPIFKNSKDKAFVLHQDTIFYDHIKYSGLIYTLYNTKDTMMVTSYLNGLEEGVQTKWYPNQQIASVRNYHAGKKTGKHIGYWENGQPKFEFYFEDGEHHGVAKEWYQNGQYYRTFHYEHGYEQGSQKMWWENGMIRANYVVKNGRRYGLVGLKLCMNQNDTSLKKTK